jgi:hypothetical protein
MALNKTIQREIEVAFSKKSQPVWFRIAKYILLACIFYFFWGSKLLWVIIPVTLILSLCLHFWYRYKTNGWRNSYGMWKYDKEETYKEKE